MVAAAVAVPTAAGSSFVVRTGAGAAAVVDVVASVLGTLPATAPLALTAAAVATVWRRRCGQAHRHGTVAAGWIRRGAFSMNHAAWAGSRIDGMGDGDDGGGGDDSGGGRSSSRSSRTHRGTGSLAVGSHHAAEPHERSCGAVQDVAWAQSGNRSRRVCAPHDHLSGGGGGGAGAQRRRYRR